MSAPICKLCADLCEEVAELCGDFEEPEMHHCAQLCLNCVRACRKIEQEVRLRADQQQPQIHRL